MVSERDEGVKIEVDLDDAKPRVASSSNACLTLGFPWGSLGFSLGLPNPNPKPQTPNLRYRHAGMSSGPTSDGGRKYKPLAPPKRQITFTSTRRTAKPASLVPALNRKQSSLTQMQWVGTPRQVIDISSGEDDDGNYKEPPAKRRKSSATPSAKKGRKTKFEERENGQSSFTQVDYLANMRRKGRRGLNEHGFQVWQNSDTEDEIGNNGELDFPYPGQGAGLREDEQENEVPEIAESSQNDSNGTQQQEPLEPTLPEKAAAKLRTPQKVRFAEVPSSQTPPSTGKSTKRRFHRNLSRSPFKERSANARSPTKKPPSPESQDISMRMLERARFANRQARRKTAIPQNQLDEDLIQCAAEATDEFSLRTCPMPPPPPRPLQRTTTVQDSQADDLDTLTGEAYSNPDAKLERVGTIPDSQRQSSNETIVEDSQFRQPVRKLKRVATVQDSQADDADIEFDGDDLAPKETIDFDDVTNSYDNNYLRNEQYPEGTYDPAFSALDRDATRFNWTQSQHRDPRVGEDSETEDEDLDRACADNGWQQIKASSESASQEINGSLPPVVRQPASRREIPRAGNAKEGAANAQLDEGVQRDDSAYESGDLVLTVHEHAVPSSPSPPSLPEQPESRTASRSDNADAASVPSSPPPLRASQVSTVVPTQASIAPRNPSPRKTIKTEPLSLPPTPRNADKSQAFSLLSSPCKASSQWQPETLSSSPLPLPPWSSPEKHRGFDLHPRMECSIGLGSEPQLDSLADFSLPPPPPLSSSRRQTPASSSL